MVTSPLEASGDPSRASLINSLEDDDVEGVVHPDYPFAVFWNTESSREGADYLGSAVANLPIEGEWSDYMVEFEMHHENESVVFELGQMGVL